MTTDFISSILTVDCTVCFADDKLLYTSAFFGYNTIDAVAVLEGYHHRLRIVSPKELIYND